MKKKTYTISEDEKKEVEMEGKEKEVESLSGFFVFVLYSAMMIAMGIILFFQATTAKPHAIATFLSLVLTAFMLNLGTKLGSAQVQALKERQFRLGILVSGNFGLIFTLALTSIAEVDYPTLALILLILGIVGFLITIPYMILRNKASKNLEK